LRKVINTLVVEDLSLEGYFDRFLPQVFRLWQLPRQNATLPGFGPQGQRLRIAPGVDIAALDGIHVAD
jgi:hypothetical protein